MQVFISVFQIFYISIHLNIRPRRDVVQQGQNVTLLDQDSLTAPQALGGQFAVPDAPTDRGFGDAQQGGSLVHGEEGRS